MCFIAVPIPALAYHVPTQPPSNLTLTVDYENGTVKADWDASDQMEDYPAERYAIGFGLSDEGSMPYAIATGNVGDSNALNTEYTFTASYLQSLFNEAHGLFHVKIRSDNDTNSSYSEWTPTVSVTIQNKPAKVSNLASSVDNSGDNLTITWDANNNGFVSASNYKIFSKTNETEWTQVLVTTNTSYSFKATETNSWEFRVDACGSEGDCNSSSTNVTFNYTVPTTTTSSTTTSSTTTTTTTLPPPPPPTTTTTLAPVIVKIGGEEVEYTQSEVDDGTVDRDIERQANKDKWGCYITDIALERGDCPAYNDSLKQEEEKEEVIIEIKDEKFTDTETELLDDDVVVLEVESNDEIKDIEDELVEEIIEEEIKIDNKELEEEFKFEEEEIIIEIPEEIIIIIEEDVEEEVIQDELDEEIFTDDTESEKEIQKEDEVFFEEVEITEEQIQEEVKQVEEKIKVIQETNVKELETEQVVEIIEEVNDAGLENLAEVSEDVLEVVAEVVEQSIAKADELTQEQQEVVAEVLGFTETKDVEVLAKAVKTDKTVAKAVEEYVERAVQNADVENYTLADAQTEITFESLVAGDFSVIIDIDLDAIDLANISNDMTQDTKEKAQEVILPTVIVNIVSFVRRFN